MFTGIASNITKSKKLWVTFKLTGGVYTLFILLKVSLVWYGKRDGDAFLIIFDIEFSVLPCIYVCVNGASIYHPGIL